MEPLLRSDTRQSRLNCCSVNGPRGIGMFAEWAFMESERGVAVNYFGPSTLSGLTPGKQQIHIVQETEYPLIGDIRLNVRLRDPEAFELKVRIPDWSANTQVKLNGQPIEGVMPGQYLSLDRVWSEGDRLEMALDMSLHYWVGEKEKAGSVSIYRGPILLAFDQRFNEMDIKDMATIRPETLTLRQVETKIGPAPWLIVEGIGSNGETVRLCDFASAGVSGTCYATWLRTADSLVTESGKAAEPAWIAIDFSKKVRFSITIEKRTFRFSFNYSH